MIAVVVTMAFIVAITQTAADRSASGTLAEVQAVTVIGDPLPVFAADGPDEAVGRKAPTLDGRGFSGSQVTTGPGNPTLVVFLAHWCQHCQYEVPVLVRWGASNSFPDALDVVAVTTSTDQSAPNYPPSAWLAAEEWPPLWPVLTDDAQGTAGNAFGLAGFPYLVLTDADGTVLWRHSGRITAEDLADTLSTILPR